MDNIKVTPHGGSTTRMSASFTTDDARYHVWIDARTMTLEAPILYKNPPHGVGYKMPGHFDTRRLNATTPKNAKLIAELLKAVSECKLVEAAIAQMQLEVAHEHRERRVTAFTRASWAAAMRGDGNLPIPDDISLPEFKAASRKLADRIWRTIFDGK
jgi:hypothetical protein